MASLLQNLFYWNVIWAQNRKISRLLPLFSYQAIHNNNAFLLFTIPEIYFLNHASIPYQSSKNAKILIIFFIFGNISLFLSRMIFVGTLPIYVIFLDMLHCLAKKICLYPKHFSLVIQTLHRSFPFHFWPKFIEIT